MLLSDIFEFAMSDAVAPVTENKVEVPAVVEEAAPADVPKAEETTVSP